MMKNKNIKIETYWNVNFHKLELGFVSNGLK